MKYIVDSALDNGFPDGKLPTLRKILGEHTNIFRTSFSSGLPADVPNFKINLYSDATPVRMRLRKYSQDKKALLAETSLNAGVVAQ